MGRKIPAKKHRGVKDPLKQQAKRLQSIQQKINAPPRDPDEQPVPRSLTRLFQLPDTRKPKTLQHKHQQPIGKKGGEGGKNGASGVRGLKRAPGESARDFSRRITGAVRALHDPLPEHYPGGEDDVDEVVEDRGARRRMRNQKLQQQKGLEPAERPTRAQRRRQKMQLKRKEKQAVSSAERSEVQYERVPFGEAAAAPPALTAPRRAKPSDSAPRPGQRQLLLSAMLRAPAAADAAERQRLAAVAAYRALKASKRGGKPATAS